MQSSPAQPYSPMSWAWQSAATPRLLVPADQIEAWRRAVHGFQQQTGVALPIRVEDLPSAGPAVHAQRELLAWADATDPAHLHAAIPTHLQASGVPVLVEPYLLLSTFPGPPLPVDLTLPLAEDLAARLLRGEPSPIAGVRLGRLSDRRPGRQAWRVGGVWPGVFSVARGQYRLGRTIWLHFEPGSVWASDPRLRAFVSWLQSPAGRTCWLDLPPEMRLAAVGDVMLDRGVRRQTETKGWQYPLARVAERLASYDLTVCNLESSLGDRSRGQPVPGKGIWFLAPPTSVRLLLWAGFDAVSVANNHALDFGVEPFVQNLELLRQARIGTFGGGLNLSAARQAWLSPISPSRPFRLAFLGYSPFADTYWSARTRWSFAATPSRAGIAPTPTPASLKQDITQARAAGARYVIVYYHWGTEYAAVPPRAVRQLARQAIAAGADLVLGSHPHVLEGIEWVDGHPVAYSLGNFVMDQPWPITRESMILEIDLDSHGLRGVSPLPVAIDAAQPSLPSGPAASYLESRVHYLNLLLTITPPPPAAPQPR